MPVCKTLQPCIWHWAFYPHFLLSVSELNTCKNSTWARPHPHRHATSVECVKRFVPVADHGVQQFNNLSIWFSSAKKHVKWTILKCWSAHTCACSAHSSQILFRCNDPFRLCVFPALLVSNSLLLYLSHSDPLISDVKWIFYDLLPKMKLHFASIWCVTSANIRRHTRRISETLRLAYTVLIMFARQKKSNQIWRKKWNRTAPKLLHNHMISHMVSSDFGHKNYSNIVKYFLVDDFFPEISYVTFEVTF